MKKQTYTNSSSHLTSSPRSKPLNDPLPLINDRRFLYPRQPKRRAPPQVLARQPRSSDPATSGALAEARIVERVGEVAGLRVEPAVDEGRGVAREGGQEVAFRAGVAEGNGDVGDLG